MSEFICKVARDKFNTQKSTVFLCTSDEQEETNLKHRFGNRNADAAQELLARGAQARLPAAGRARPAARRAAQTRGGPRRRNQPPCRDRWRLDSPRRAGRVVRPELTPCVNRTSIFQKVRNLHTEPRKTWLTSHVRGLWGAVLSGSQCHPPRLITASTKSNHKTPAGFPK